MADRHAPGVSISRDRSGIVGADHAEPIGGRTGRLKTKKQVGCTRKKTDQGLRADGPSRAKQSRQLEEEERSLSPRNTSGVASSATKAFVNLAGTLPVEVTSSPVTQDRRGELQTERYRPSLAYVPLERRKRSRPASHLVWAQTYASLGPIGRVIALVSGAPQRIPFHPQGSRPVPTATRLPFPGASRTQPARLHLLSLPPAPLGPHVRRYEDLLQTRSSTSRY